ncbi:hypothetical protein CONPUDRAFT_157533 [Coniophora puteana RWD-64-598 SS2]|uniref:Uncharacterized protein n=1 Tax=Coniophora puteana (strain RWD-64-598) TaxID=741705 RepID=A0A5M3MDR4_CONPW|nr:uncharacterized protein CONPUDRAFT_157533 [Coniophora puteana RWD-64-598 SS2]EIW77273.1 hypothetical protein CONPUDRAFT_157533 [Coniophora puteana RWD-64-598 SS2]
MIPSVSHKSQFSALPPEKARAMERLVKDHQMIKKRTKRTFHMFPKGNMEVKAASADDITAVGTSGARDFNHLNAVSEVNDLAVPRSRKPATSITSATPSASTPYPTSATSANNTSAPGSANTEKSGSGSSTSISNAYGGLSVPQTPSVQVRSMKESISQLGLGGQQNGGHQPLALAGGNALKARPDLFGYGVPTFGGSPSSSTSNLLSVGSGSRVASAASSTESLPLRPLPHPPPSGSSKHGAGATRVPDGYLQVGPGPGTLKVSTSEPVVPRTRAVTLEGRTELRELGHAMEWKEDRERAQALAAVYARAHAHTHGASPHGPRKQLTLHTFPSVQSIPEEKEKQQQRERAQEGEPKAASRSTTVSNSSDSPPAPRACKPKERKVLPPLLIPPHPSRRDIILCSPEPLSQPQPPRRQREGSPRPDDAHPDPSLIVDVSPSTLKRRSTRSRTNSAPLLPSPSTDQRTHRRPGTAQTSLSPTTRGPVSQSLSQVRSSTHAQTHRKATSKSGADMAAHVSSVLLTVEPPTAVRPKEPSVGGSERGTAATPNTQPPASPWSPAHGTEYVAAGASSSSSSGSRPYSLSKQRYVRPATSHSAGSVPPVPAVPHGAPPSEETIREMNEAAAVRMRRLSEVSVVDVMMAMEPAYRQSVEPPMGLSPAAVRAAQRAQVQVQVQAQAQASQVPSSPVVERDNVELERERREKERKEKERRVREAREREKRHKEKEAKIGSDGGSSHKTSSDAGSGVVRIDGGEDSDAGSLVVEKKDAWPWAPPDAWAGPQAASTNANAGSNTSLPLAGKPLTKSPSPATSTRSGTSANAAATTTTTSSSGKSIFGRSRGHSVSGDTANVEKRGAHAGTWIPPWASSSSGSKTAASGYRKGSEPFLEEGLKAAAAEAFKKAEVAKKIEAAKKVEAAKKAEASKKAKAAQDEYSVRVQRHEGDKGEETRMDDVLPKLRALRLK